MYSCDNFMVDHVIINIAFVNKYGTHDIALVRSNIYCTKLFKYGFYLI